MEQAAACPARQVSSAGWGRLRTPGYERLQHVLFPTAAGLATGMAALAYPEVLYQVKTGSLWAGVCSGRVQVPSQVLPLLVQIVPRGGGPGGRHGRAGLPRNEGGQCVQ